MVRNKFSMALLGIEYAASHLFRVNIYRPVSMAQLRQDRTGQHTAAIGIVLDMAPITHNQQRSLHQSPGVYAYRSYRPHPCSWEGRRRGWLERANTGSATESDPDGETGAGPHTKIQPPHILLGTHLERSRDAKPTLGKDRKLGCGMSGELEKTSVEGN